MSFIFTLSCGVHQNTERLSIVIYIFEPGVPKDVIVFLSRDLWALSDWSFPKNPCVSSAGLLQVSPWKASIVAKSGSNYCIFKPESIEIEEEVCSGHRFPNFVLCQWSSHEKTETASAARVAQEWDILVWSIESRIKINLFVRNQIQSNLYFVLS